MKKLFVIMVLAVFAAVVVSSAMAAKPGNMTSLDSLWIGPQSTWLDSTIVDGAGDLHVTGEVDFGAAADFDYNQTRNLPLTGWLKGPYLVSPVLSDGLNATTLYPVLTAHNGTWSLYWPASQTASVVYPATRVTKWASGSNIAWRALVRWTGTHSTPTNASKYLQWSLLVNTGNSTIATASTAMTAVAIPTITTASQSILTLTPNAVAQASLVEGAWYTIMVGPTAHNVASGTGAGDLYMIGFEEYRP